MTHSIYNGNLTMVKYLFSSGPVNSKKILKIPGLFSTSEVNKLFPFYIALHKDSVELFEFFWTAQLEGVQLQWSEETLDSLFRLLARRQATHFLEPLLRSRTTLSLFRAMSHQYRYSFIASLLDAKAEILLEINDLLTSYNKNQTRSTSKQAKHFGDISDIQAVADHSLDASYFDADQFLSEKVSELSHFFNKTYDELAREPTFAPYFYLTFTRQLARDGVCTDQNLDILRRCLKNVSDDDIEMLLFYETDTAMQIVDDMQKSRGTGLDMETCAFAARIRLSPHFSKY